MEFIGDERHEVQYRLPGSTGWALHAFSGNREVALRYYNDLLELPGRTYDIRLVSQFIAKMDERVGVAA